MSLVLIVSAPSGSGKSTLVRRLLERDPKLIFSISYTTRPPRGTERPGENYHYIERAEFEARVRNEEFLEYAEVFGNYYGTHRSILDSAHAQLRDVVLDIDVQGARQLKRKIPDAVSVFILAPSREILEQRLRNRSEDAEGVIQRRLTEAAREIRFSDGYDYVVVNHDLDESAGTLEAIVRAERVRRFRMQDQIDRILGTFETDHELSGGAVSRQGGRFDE
jgi:guanylate kinase